MKQRIPKYSRRSIMGLDNSHTIRTDDIGQDRVRLLDSTSLRNAPALYTLDIPDNSLQMRLFEQNHPRLVRLLRKLEQAPNCLYARLQRNEAWKNQN